MWKEIWEYMKSEDGAIPALIGAGGLIGGGILSLFGKKKEREWQTEQSRRQFLEQWRMGRAQDITGATTRAEQLEFLGGPGGLPDITAAEFTAPDEAVFERMRQLGVEDITESGRFQQQAQAEQLAGAGLGVSSIGMGAQQRMAQRTGREIGRFETGIAQQQYQAQIRYEQLVAADAARVQQAQAEKASLLAGYMGPDVEEVKDIWAEFRG